MFLLEPVFSTEVWSFMCDPVSQDNEASVCSSMAQVRRRAWHCRRCSGLARMSSIRCAHPWTTLQEFLLL